MFPLWLGLKAIWYDLQFEDRIGRGCPGPPWPRSKRQIIVGSSGIIELAGQHSRQGCFQLKSWSRIMKKHFARLIFFRGTIKCVFSSIAMWCKSLYQIILQNVHAKKVVDGKFVSSDWYFQWHYLVIAAASDGNGTAFAAAICLTWATIGWEHPPNKPPLRGPTKPLWTLKPLPLPLMEPFSIICKWSCASKHCK